MLTKLFITCVFLCVMSRITLGQKNAKKYCSGIQPPLSNIYGIIGGIQTEDAEFPHMVALGYEDSNNPKWLCGGSLITSQFVVTAGHCAETRAGPVIKVRLGTRRLTNPSIGYEDVNVNRIIFHPDYKPPAHYNDIALLELAPNASLSKQILPACLHTTVSITSKELTAVGWGKTDFAGSTSNDLLKVALRTFTRSACNKHYKNVGAAKLQRGIDNKIQVCAGSSSNEKKDTCQGDSGGPLGYKKDRNHYIVGITSFGKACGLTGVPAVYTRISAYVKWIESIVWS